MDANDQLFGMFRPGPFARGMAGDPGLTAYESQSPGIAPLGFVDELDTQFMTDFVLYGVYNGAFGAAPPLGLDTDIVAVSNELPGFPGGVTQVSGNAITAEVIADADSSSGHNLRFNIASGSAGDEGYVQTVNLPIGNDRARRQDLYFRATFHRVTASGGTPRGTVEAQYLTATGATTGSAYTGTKDLTANDTTYVLSLAPSAAPPADAAYVRLRYGVKRNTMGTTDTATIDLANARTDRGGAVVLVSEQSQQDTYAAGQIYATSGSIYLASALNGLRVPEQTPVSNPPSGFYAIYAKTDGKLYGKNDAGTEVELGGGGSIDYAESGDISTQAFGDSPAAGASVTEVAGANHKHGMPANPVTAHAADENGHGRWTAIIVKAGDESVATSTVLQNDDDFFFTTVNLAHYEFEMVILYVNTVGNTGDLKMVFGEDTNNRGAVQSVGIGAADTATTQNAVTDQTETIILGAATGERTAVLKGAFRGAGGTWRLKWAQNSSSGTTKILAGSVFRYRRIV